VTKKIRRIAHGMRNFENYRLRLLLHSGVQWGTRPTARIRGAPHGWPSRAAYALHRQAALLLKLGPAAGFPEKSPNPLGPSSRFPTRKLRVATARRRPHSGR